MGRLQRLTSLALHAAVGCTKTYVVQFAEHPQHPHVHFHIIPRMADIYDDVRGPGVFKHLGVPESERVSAARMNEVAQTVRATLVPLLPISSVTN